MVLMDFYYSLINIHCMEEINIHDMLVIGTMLGWHSDCAFACVNAELLKEFFDRGEKLKPHEKSPVHPFNLELRLFRWVLNWN
jgi:hypothetical protein